MAMILESVDRSQRFPIDRESIFVGSSEWKSDICLTGQDIADVHCELTLDEHGVRVTALADSGVTVNGQTVREASLSAGDELGIAMLRFRLSCEGMFESNEATPSDSKTDQEPVASHLSRWLVRMSGMNLGPLDWDELQTMISRGEVRLDDEVQREHESAWQPLRDVVPKAGGDGLLCDDSPAESVDYEPASRRARSKHRSMEADSELSDDSTEEVVEEPVEVETPLPPQFFIRRDEEEVGPLPRQAVQELADEGAVLADTPVRLEEEEKWSTAAAVGIRCRSAAPREASPEDSRSGSGSGRAFGVAWLLFTPYYFVSGVARTISGIDPRRTAKWTVGLLIVGVVAFGWLRSWSQTAMSGVVTLDGQPVAGVLVQLTGAQTGDSAMGVSGDGGKFRVVTLDGELKPGLYLVTVRLCSEVDGEHSGAAGSDKSATEVPLPDRYRHLNRTDATIEITADRSRYSIELMTEPQSASGGAKSGAMSASHSLP